MKFPQIIYMAVSRLDFWFFIIELVTRNPNLGIHALEDGLFASLLIFDYFCAFEFLKVGQMRFLIRIHAQCQADLDAEVNLM